ncbi:MAG TPA: DUF2065 domain-containing protein [Aestuariivirga sp.]|nr:DUF2065 domain-containing protein [Aestuariivirga sp.]
MTVEFLVALGLVFVIEGLLYALVPGHLKRMLRTMQDLSDDQLRVGGVSAIAFGVMIVWLVRGIGG